MGNNNGRNIAQNSTVTNVIIPIYLNDQAHELFNKPITIFNKINILDFFPMLRNRITTEFVVDNLIEINRLLTGKIFSLGLHKRILRLDDEDPEKIKEEESISSDLLRMMEDHRQYLHTWTIYRFIETSSSLNKRLTAKLITHPNINSLLASVEINNIDLVLSYMYKFDPRSNNMEIYYSSSRSSVVVKKIIECVIITRILLEKEVFSSISYDIWNYYCMSEMPLA